MNINKTLKATSFHISRILIISFVVTVIINLIYTNYKITQLYSDEFEELYSVSDYAQFGKDYFSFHFDWSWILSAFFILSFISITIYVFDTEIGKKWLGLNPNSTVFGFIVTWVLPCLIPIFMIAMKGKYYEGFIVENILALVELLLIIGLGLFSKIPAYPIVNVMIMAGMYSMFSRMHGNNIDDFFLFFAAGMVSIALLRAVRFVVIFFTKNDHSFLKTENQK